MNWYIIHCAPSNYTDIVKWTVNRSMGTACNLLTLSVFTRLSAAELTLLQLQWLDCDIHCLSSLIEAVREWNTVLQQNQPYVEQDL